MTYSNKFSVFDFAFELMSHIKVRFQSFTVLDELSEGSLYALSLLGVLESGLRGLIRSQGSYDLTVLGLGVRFTLDADLGASISHDLK